MFNATWQKAVQLRMLKPGVGWGGAPVPHPLDPLCYSVYTLWRKVPRNGNSDLRVLRAVFRASACSKHMPNVPISKPMTGTTNVQHHLQEDRRENTRVIRRHVYCTLEATLTYRCWHSSILLRGRNTGYITDITVIYSNTETSRAWKLRWCLWLLSRLNNSQSFLSFFFWRQASAVAVDGAPRCRCSRLRKILLRCSNTSAIQPVSTHETVWAAVISI